MYALLGLHAGVIFGYIIGYLFVYMHVEERLSDQSDGLAGGIARMAGYSMVSDSPDLYLFTGAAALLGLILGLLCDHVAKKGANP